MRQKVLELKEEVDEKEDKINKEKNRVGTLTKERENLKKHVILLTERNGKLVDAIERTMERDESAREMLNRRAKLEMILENTQRMWDKNISVIEKNLNLSALTNKETI